MNANQDSRRAIRNRIRVHLRPLSVVYFVVNKNPPRSLPMIRSVRLLSLAAAVLAIPFVVRADEAKPAEKVTFQDHVLPIFRAKCGKCHGAGEAKGGLVLESFSAAMMGGASGEVVEPGDLDASRLWALVSHKEQPAMPPNEPKLPDEMLAVIQKWIAGGALENKDSQPKLKKKSSLTLSTTAVSTDKPAGP